MSKNIMEARDLHYTYGDGTHALKGLSIEIQRGKTTAVLGGNGAGKSTLFLSLNGTLKPASGQVLFKGLPVGYSKNELNRLRKAVGIVFQDSDSQLFSSSVFQDISFGPMNMKLPEEEVRRRVNAAIEKTGILHLKDKPTHYLSFGQKKRAAIAGVLAMQPEVLILDEPTAGLDPMGAAEIMQLLNKVKEELDATVVFATHDVDIVSIYCDYAYVLDQGRVVLKGTPKEIFSTPELLRKVHLRLPRIAHLMEILQKNDGFDFEERASTISEARKELKKWMRGNNN